LKEILSINKYENQLAQENIELFNRTCYIPIATCVISSVSRISVVIKNFGKFKKGNIIKRSKVKQFKIQKINILLRMKILLYL